MSVKGFRLADGSVAKYDYSALENVITDNTLSISGVAADAETVGNEIAQLEARNFDLDESDRLKISGLSGTTSEVTDRIETLRQYLTAEVSTRSAKDISIESELAESRDRMAEIETGISESIDRLPEIEEDISESKDRLTELETNLSDEIANRIAADNTEKTERREAVTLEKNERVAADNALSTRINIEKSRIDNIEALPDGATTADAELINIRIGYDNTEHSSAGNAVRTQISDVKADLSYITANPPIVFVPNKYIKTSGSTVDVNAPVDSGTGFGYAVIDVSSGDTFTINSAGGSNARAWCWIDSNGSVIDRSASGESASGLVISAPPNADKLVINAKNTDSPSYYGEVVGKAIKRLNETTQYEIDYQFVVGGLSTSENAGEETSNAGRARTGFLSIASGKLNSFDWSKVGNFTLAYIFQYQNGAYVSKTSTATIESGVLSFNASVNANQCRFVIKKSNNSEISSDDLVGVFVPRIERLDEALSIKLNEIEEEIANKARPLSLNEEQYVFSQNLIKYKELTNVFNGLSSNLKFADFYNKFHEIYTTYGSANLGMEEINISSEVLESSPSYFESIQNAGMYLWHIPSLPDNDYQTENTYKRIKVFITSGIHGSERNAIVTIYAFMDMLLHKYGEIPETFRNLDFYIMPLCNPYGIENNGSYNGNDININRDFPVEKWQADIGDHSSNAPESQYETKCIMYAIDQVKPDVLIDHHCFSGNVVGATKRLYWGTSGYGITVSKLYEVFAQLNSQVVENFSELFSDYNFIYAYTRYVSDTSGTLSRWSCEQGINGATVECPNTLRWDEAQGYIWDTTDSSQKDLVSVSEMYFTNALKLMCGIVEYAKNRKMPLSL